MTSVAMLITQEEQGPSVLEAAAKAHAVRDEDPRTCHLSAGFRVQWLGVAWMSLST